MVWRYTDSNERSAEILLAALRLMVQHLACFNPITFAVWYEYVAVTNASLSRAIDDCQRAPAVLGDVEIQRHPPRQFLGVSQCLPAEVERRA